MAIIKQEDFIQSIADAFQYISYYHPTDYIEALKEALAREENLILSSYSMKSKKLIQKYLTYYFKC